MTNPSFSRFLPQIHAVLAGIPEGAVFVLGSQDAEMARIEELLADHGVPYVFAGTRKDGNLARVAPGVSATVLIDPAQGAEYIPNGRPLIGIEVASAPGFVFPFSAHIDHHAPGDFRTDAPAELAWAASSIGQVWCLLFGWRLIESPEPSAVLVMAGESDHNLPAFARGRCSTLAEDARAYVLRTRHEVFGGHLTFEGFVAAVEQAAETLRGAPAARDPLTGEVFDDVADLLALEPDAPPAAGTGEVYPSAAQFLPVAAGLAGRAYAVRIKRGDGRLALRLGGFPENHTLLVGFAARPEAWGVFGTTAPRPDNAYAFPARGMGGGTFLY
jgi:hypothetical protein